MDRVVLNKKGGGGLWHQKHDRNTGKILTPDSWLCATSWHMVTNQNMPTGEGPHMHDDHHGTSAKARVGTWMRGTPPSFPGVSPTMALDKIAQVEKQSPTPAFIIITA